MPEFQKKLEGCGFVTEQKTAGKRHAAVRTLAMPADTNSAGDIFGGWLMSQMDIAGEITARQRARTRVVTVAVDGMEFHQPVYVGDVVRLNIAAIRSDFVGPVNIGTGVETDVMALFNILKDASEKDIEEIHGLAKTGEQMRSVLDNSLAEKVFGWKPEVSIEEGLKLTYKWFKENS